jgi:hypothetical protein
VRRVLTGGDCEGPSPGGGRTVVCAAPDAGSRRVGFHRGAESGGRLPAWPSRCKAPSQSSRRRLARGPWRRGAPWDRPPATPPLSPSALPGKRDRRIGHHVAGARSGIDGIAVIQQRIRPQDPSPWQVSILRLGAVEQVVLPRNDRGGVLDRNGALSEDDVVLDAYARAWRPGGAPVCLSNRGKTASGLSEWSHRQSAGRPACAAESGSLRLRWEPEDGHKVTPTFLSAAAGVRGPDRSLATPRAATRRGPGRP